MKKKLVHTPPGVRDLYYLEYARKEAVENHILDIFKRYGYRGIQTPTFEFFDIFSKEKGSVSERNMYKLIDREGNTLVLRPDITPSIARAVAKYFPDEDMPIRLCYKGNTFTSQYSYRGRLAETTQMGAELLGDATSDADAEMIAMLIDSLLSAGLENFQVEIGHVGFYKGLLQEAGLDEEEETQLRMLIEEKNYFGLEEMLSKFQISEHVKRGFIELPKLFGSLAQIKQAKQITGNPLCQQAVKYLEKLYGILKEYGLEKYVSFDLSILGNYRYYTGIVFQAYTYDTGEAIATGGRYDKLIEQYGKKSDSVGFGIFVDGLMLAMNRQQIEIETDIHSTILLYERCHKKEALTLASVLRSNSNQIQTMKKYYEKSLDDYIAYAKRSYIQQILFIDEEGTIWQIDCETEEKKELSVECLKNGI